MTWEGLWSLFCHTYYDQPSTLSFFFGFLGPPPPRHADVVSAARAQCPTAQGSIFLWLSSASQDLHERRHVCVTSPNVQLWSLPATPLLSTAPSAWEE